MKRCEGYKKHKIGLAYCNGIIWPWQKSVYHVPRKDYREGHIANGFDFTTHKGHKTIREVMDDLIIQPLLGDY